MKVQIPNNEALRMILPGVVGLVTTHYRGKFDITTVSWLMPAGREPPLVAMAVHPATMCYDMIKRSSEFVINIPTRDVINQVVTCGRISGNELDKFERTGLRMAEPHTVSTPYIEQCIGHLECAVVNVFTPGDHVIFIGQIAYATVEQDAFDESWLLAENDLKPLHHLGGATFATLEVPIDATPPDIKAAMAAQLDDEPRAESEP
jgi:flavin reductase (DIM6/NTAB) family NADH-FMN oxidoreductase RutF